MEAVGIDHGEKRSAEGVYASVGRWCLSNCACRGREGVLMRIQASMAIELG